MVMASSQHRCVFVGNIPYDATEEQLIQICEEVGPVVSFRLVIDRETGKPKGYGFCEYKDEETALSARRNLQGYEINGRQLRVDFAENDKGADRNREQGRGGPGLIAGLDTQKHVGGPAILGDATLNQPIGLSVAANAASAITVAMNDAQVSGTSSARNGFQSQPGFGTDPMTLYLAKMSRNQLHEILSQLQALTKQNQSLARQILLASPQLTKAIFQALIMLGMVPPQVLQLPNIRQAPASLLPPFLLDGQQLPSQQIQPLLQTNVQVGLLKRLPDGKLPAVPPLHQNIHGPPRIHVVSQTQNQVPLQLGQSGATSGLTAQVQPLTGLPILQAQTPLTASKPLQQQMPPPLPQQPRPVGYAVLGNVQSTIQNSAHLQSLPPLPVANQDALKSGLSSATVIGGQHAGFRDSGGSASVINSMHSTFHSSLMDQSGFTADTSDVPLRPSKLAKLDDGNGFSVAMGGSSVPGVAPAPASISGTSSISINQISNANVAPNAEQHAPQLQLPPEVESALLQQVMNLTPEQLSSLSPEQRQQVLQLQQMLR